MKFDSCMFMGIVAMAALPSFADVKSISSPPVIDGRLDDACWQSATFDDDFKRTKLTAGKGPLGRRTAFAICADADTVYVAVRCFVPDVEAVRSMKDGSIWTRDNVELFFAPSGTAFDYYHFAISPNSTDVCADYRSEGGNIQPDPFAPKWRHAVGYEKDAWVAEMAIPLSAFYMTRNADWKQTWRMNVARTMQKPYELASWSQLTDTFHAPGLFRRLGGFPMRKTADDRVVRTALADITSRADGRFTGTLKLNVWTALAGDYAIRTSVGPETAVTLKAGGNKVSVPCVYAKDGRIATEITLVDRTGRETTRSYPVFVEYRPIRVKLTTPQYRNNFYPGQDTGRVAGSVTVPEGVTAELTLEGPGFPTRTAKVTTQGTFAFDTTGFATGEAWLTVTAGKDVEKVRIRNLPPTGHMMTWVENGNLVVNGRPTLRRNIYAQGFRTGKAFNERFAREKDSFRLTEVGKTLGASPGEYKPGFERAEAIHDIRPNADFLATLKAKAEKFRDTDYGGWYISDEPECRNVSPIYLHHVYEYLKEIDPYHVVFTASRGGVKYIDCADWFETHPYIDPRVPENGKRTYGTPPSEVGAFIDAYEPAAHPDKCIGFLPTCFAYRWTSWSNDYPTFDEYVLHTWAAMMRGGKTLWPYAGHDLGDRSALYNGTRYVFESFEALEEIVLNGTRTTFLKGNDLEGVAYALPDEKMIVIVNFAFTNAVAKVAGVTGAFREFRGTRTFGFNAGQVSTVTLRPLETLVATTKPHDANLEPKAETEARVAREEAERCGRDNQLLDKTTDLTVDTNMMRNFGGGHYKLVDGMCEMIAMDSKWRTNAFVEIACNGFRPSFDTVRVWGSGIVDRFEVDVRKGGAWVNVPIKARSREKYRHEVTLTEPVSTVKVRLRFPGRPKQENALEIYEVELPRLKEGARVAAREPLPVKTDEGMRVIWDGANCPVSKGWSDKAWIGEDTVRPCEGGGFTLQKTASRYLEVRPEDDWIVFDIAAFHDQTVRGYRAWIANLDKLCGLGQTVTHPHPGIYTMPLPKVSRAEKHLFRIYLYGLTADFNAIRVGRAPANRVEISSSTQGVIAPGSTVSVRAHLAEACEDVAAEFLSTPSGGDMKPFRVNGVAGVELRKLDEKGYLWGADFAVKTCGKEKSRNVWLKVVPLDGTRARPVFGSVSQRFDPNGGL